MGATSSSISAQSGNQFAGSASFGGTSRAGLWTGSSASWQSLHPADPSISASRVWATDSVTQVGTTELSGQFRAAKWLGSASSYVDLTPVSAVVAEAFGVRGGATVGYFKTSFSGGERAALWLNNSAVLDLTPSSASSSVLYDTDSVVQVGKAEFGSSNHAGIWQGSASSFVSLAPAGSISSVAYYTAGGVQVGEADYGSGARAALWQGNSNSFVNLTAFLPVGQFQSSGARMVWTDSNATYVVGYGRHTDGSTEALMWVSTSPVPEPGTVIVLTVGIVVTMLRRRSG
ncbi:MAG: PEP-CTERM sorting domain-containing protein [Armatimonadota bacterium]